MTEMILKIFVKDYKNVNNRDTRNKVGKVSSIIGILCNLLLSLSKYIIGTIVHSVSIQADGINNLSDASNNIVSILAFYISNKPADKEHPYGHERSETIGTFLVTVMIAIIGFDMLKDSISKIIHPEAIDFRMITIIILLLSIAVKCWMYFFNTELSNRYNSSMLKAVAVDSISDVLGTAAILISTIVSYFIHFNLDGYMGVIVSLLIFYNAYGLFKDVINPLLGEAPQEEDIDQIKSIIVSHKGVYGVHDILIHSYGMDQKYASAHVEVNGNEDLFTIHEIIDHIEREIKDTIGIEIVLHMDPLKINDPDTENYKNKILGIINELNKDWSIHDLRYVDKENIKYLYFDLLIPFEDKESEEEINNLFSKQLNEYNLKCIITIDHK